MLEDGKPERLENLSRLLPQESKQRNTDRLSLPGFIFHPLPGMIARFHGWLIDPAGIYPKRGNRAASSAGKSAEWS